MLHVVQIYICLHQEAVTLLHTVVKEILLQIICTSYIAIYYELTCSIDSTVGNMKNKLEGNTS